uniref:Amino acid transporter heavy chain SLC3A1 n=1 Tax=Callorhinchus milii TaxID=7868 RepID=V9KE73_CALMI
MSSAKDGVNRVDIDLKEKQVFENSAFNRDEEQQERERTSNTTSESDDETAKPNERLDSQVAMDWDQDKPVDSDDGPYAGMPKEVLLRYSSQLCYRLPREILFWFMLIATVALVACTIAIIALSPKCLDWWQASPIYQIYPRSFKDSNGDGIGDLNGIREKLDHFVDLNIKAIWINSVYKSPMKDFGFDVEDYEAIDPVFGTMEDFDDLIEVMHDRGLKLIMDLIPNHTSDKHRWFQLSRNRTEKYVDYYIWRDCEHKNNRTTYPNNWVSVFGHSAWEYDPVRSQCYLHQFLKEQPDLDFRNPDVQEEMKNIIRFWLKKGVDGIRVNAVKFLLEAESLRNEVPVDPNQDPNNVTYHEELYHDYTTTQVGMHDLVRSWRYVMNEFSREPGRYRFMVTESYDNEEILKTMMYYGTEIEEETDFPFNFYLIDLYKEISGNGVFKIVDSWMSKMPTGKWPNWMVGNHDNLRISSRLGTAYTQVIHMLLLTLPGTPIIYYGEEIGMENIAVSNDKIEDPLGKVDPTKNRDLSRSPMQWDNSTNAGFSTANTTWLPVHSNYTTVNVEAQKQASNSTYRLYRELSLLRQMELPIHRGWMCYVWNDTDVFAYVRELDGLNRVFLIVLNFGKTSTVNLASQVPDLPPEANVRLSTNFERNGDKVQTSQITTDSEEGLVLEYTTSNPVHNREEFKDRCYISQKACYFSALDILYKNC